MKIYRDMEQGTDEWHAFRLGKIYGTRAGGIWSKRAYTKDDIIKLLESRGIEFKKSLTKKALEDLYLTEEDKELLSVDQEKKLEYYQILADQVAVAPEDEENGIYDHRAMDRGTDYEKVSVPMAAEYLHKKVFTPGVCTLDEDERIMNSPDGLIDPEDGTDIITEAIEAKSLASAKHLMAYFERRVPEDYFGQKIQYFVVNPHLQTLYWVFYDPRIPQLPFFILVIKREDLGSWPEIMLRHQLRTLKQVDKHIERLFEESTNIMLPARPEVE